MMGGGHNSAHNSTHCMLAVTGKAGVELCLLHTAFGSANLSNHTNWQYQLKVNKHIHTYDPEIPPPPEIYPYIHPKTGTRMFLAALFIIATAESCPNTSAGEWTDNVQCSHTMEYPNPTLQ